MTKPASPPPTTERVRGTGVEVVVVARELALLVTSLIFVQIRDQWSEVTTSPDHFHSDFCLQLHFHWSGFVVLFPFICHINIKLIDILYSLAP